MIIEKERFLFPFCPYVSAVFLFLSLAQPTAGDTRVGGDEELWKRLGFREVCKPSFCAVSIVAQTFGKHALLVCFQVRLLFTLMTFDDLQNDVIIQHHFIGA